MSARDDTPELERVEELFHAAVDLPLEEREAFLMERCGADVRLRARVEALLAAAEQDLTLAPAFPGASDPHGEGAGSVVGRYKLLQQIGEGGFGVVYMAEQTEPVRRKVALKIIRLGMDSKEVVARFEAERQALAIMDHPNIARVLDGGATESGRPYFVMELVRGVSITDYCDQNQLSTRERLELFARVCRAVQHAHQKGVIHRDLKPSNVMVTMHDGQPVPKVIDFGVAKAMHSPLTEKTLFTEFGRFIGTPAYMSPEQAEFSALDVDTRSDIYSLGVLLYELLTGTTPFDPRKLLEEGLVAIQRTIREEEPQRPSIRISTSGDAAIASKRGTDPPALSRRLRGDLDWIVMKCLEKERIRRYETASEISADIARHVRDEPVLAGPPSAAYRLRKFLFRNRVAVASGGVVLLALLGGIVGTSAGMIAASRQRDEAVRARARAEQEAARTSAVTDFLIDTLALTDPIVALDANPSVASLLQKASSEVEDAFEGQPESEARVRMTIGHAFRALGENELAEHHLREGVRLAEGEDDFDAVALYDALWTLTHVLFTLDRPDAMNVAQQARRVAHGHIAETHPELADSLERFTACVIDAAFARDDGAARRLPELMQETVESSDRALPSGDPLWPIVADTWIAAGYTVWYTPIDPLTEEFFGRAALVLRRELPPHHTKRAEAVGLLVDSLNRLGKADQAEVEMRATVEEMRKVLPAETPQLALAESMLGESLSAQGKYEEAEEILVRAHEVFVASVGDTEKFLVAESFRRVLTMYDGWGKPENAARYREELQQMCIGGEFLLPWAIVRLAFPDELSELVRLGDELDRLCGTAYYTTRQVAIPGTEAAGLLRRLQSLRRERLADDHPLSLVLGRELLAWTKTLDRSGVESVLEDVVTESLDLLTAHEELFPHEVADGRILLAELLWGRGQHDAARTLAREAVPAYDGAAQRWDLAIAMVRSGRSLLRLGLLAEAERLLAPAYDSIVAHFGPENADARNAGLLLRELYTTWGRPDDASAFTPQRDHGEESNR